MADGALDGEFSPFDDHLSCTLITRELPKLFHYGLGYVLSVDVPIACAYGFDGGTHGLVRGGCGGGGGAGGWTGWCVEPVTWACMWPPDGLERMLQLQRATPTYNLGLNEIVVLKEEWDNHMPQSLQAVFYSTALDDPGEARRAHADFLRRFGRTAAQVPLLYFDPDDERQPFRVM